MKTKEKQHIGKAIALVLLFIAAISSAAVIAKHLSRSSTVPYDRQPVLQKDSNESSTDKTAWNLILVNRWNAIPEDYSVKLVEYSRGQSVDERIYPALTAMLNDAKKDGIHTVIASAYRTAEKQQRLLDEKVAEYKAKGYTPSDAKSAAESWVAIPGTSEHQLGISVDINADGIHSSGAEVYKWLKLNAYKYGFIQRYPDNKTDITGTIYEPWHYRYIGVAAATIIHQQGICLEEYIRSLK